MCPCCQLVCAGTFVASYIAKQHPQRMRGCVLIDAVCMGMFMPNLIYNFLYKKPVWQGWGKPQ
jgi:pimeloyl-ACP methyl ester carboxylesterase